MYRQREVLVPLVPLGSAFRLVGSGIGVRSLCRSSPLGFVSQQQQLCGNQRSYSSSLLRSASFSSSNIALSEPTTRRRTHSRFPGASSLGFFPTTAQLHLSSRLYSTSDPENSPLPPSFASPDEEALDLNPEWLRPGTPVGAEGGSKVPTGLDWNALAPEASTSLSGGGEGGFLNSLPNYVMDGLEWVHLTTGCPWWGTIVGATFAIRLALLAPTLFTLRKATALGVLQPELNKVNMAMAQERRKPNPNMALIRAHQEELRSMMKKAKVNPFHVLVGPACQLPVFLLFFVTLRRMSEEMPSFANGGVLWFTDLTTPDPYLILPTLMSLALWATMELGQTPSTASTGKNVHFVKYLARAFSLFLLPFSSFFPAALNVYWATNNLLSLTQALALKRPSVRKKVGLPPLPNQAAEEQQQLARKLTSTKPKK
ncbi:Mitochondrial inner membrane protein OXA1-like [Balamuthia mandrillaris]